MKAQGAVNTRILHLLDKTHKAFHLPFLPQCGKLAEMEVQIMVAFIMSDASQLQ